MATKKNTPVYLTALFLFLGGVGWLVWSGINENSVYFLNVSEALAAQPDTLKQARLFGTVAETGLEKHTQTPGVDFILQDKDDAAKTIAIVYTGVVPDTFKAGAEVIVEGGLTPTGHFAAKTLMTKCPSKYQKENRKS